MRPAETVSTPPRPDRTTLVVRLGLILLALVGVVSIFGEPLLGIGAPAADLAGPAPGPAAAPSSSP